ncbi:DUF1403 family protein [Methylocapsa sp. S129]|uniref:DUF1403 family protein n=1 Tax=Methylocapsa sp. S129 TaxID=1641869 RepID=UPI00131E7C23
MHPSQVSATSPAELLALWLADALLATRLRWTLAVPLLAVPILHPSLKIGTEGRRPRPGEADWPRLCCLAYARAAAAACDLGADFARRAEKLNSVAPNCAPRAPAP